MQAASLEMDRTMAGFLSFITRVDELSNMLGRQNLLMDQPLAATF